MNSIEDLNICQNLKPLEGTIFASKKALFEALDKAGVNLPKGYASGTKNRDLAEKEARRYIDFCPLCEVEETYEKKRTQIIVEVYEKPLPKEDGRGKEGKYISLLKPLILTKAQFEGTFLDFFFECNIFKKYFDFCKRETNIYLPDIFSSRFLQDDNIEPGLERYRGCLLYLMRSSLVRALDSLEKAGQIRWKKTLNFIPAVTIYLPEESYIRVLSKDEISNKEKSRKEYIDSLALMKNSILQPELFQAAATWKNHDFERYYSECCNCAESYIPPKSLVANQKEELAYHNYQKFIRQGTYSNSLSNSTDLCVQNKIPMSYKIFSNSSTRQKYYSFDKELLEPIMGWNKAWSSVEFSLKCTPNMLPLDVSNQIANELATRYVSYMDAHMNTIEFFSSKRYISDISKDIGEKAMRFFPIIPFKLQDSKAACRVHEALKQIYINA